MKTYIAFLRGINVGKNSAVNMGKLKSIFESLGFENVTTYINSGNVIFKSKKDPSIENIEKAIEKEFGFYIRVIIRDSNNLIDLNNKIPKEWNNKEQKTDILFLWDHFDNKKSLELLNGKDVDNLIYLKGAIVWNINREDYKKSAMNKFIGTELYKNMTARNINTLRKLVDIIRTKFV